MKDLIGGTLKGSSLAPCKSFLKDASVIGIGAESGLYPFLKDHVISSRDLKAAENTVQFHFYIVVCQLQTKVGCVDLQEQCNRV